MKLEPKDRLILMMLCDIAKQVGASDFDPDLISAAVSGGHDWVLDWEYGGVLPDHGDTDQQVKEVGDILDMWRFIETDFAALDPNEKQKVIAAYGMEPKFYGFDGNNEIEHLSIAKMMVERMGRYDHFRGRVVNSHCPTLDSALPAAARFEKVRPSLTPPNKMTSDQIIEVLGR